MAYVPDCDETSENSRNSVPVCFIHRSILALGRMKETRPLGRMKVLYAVSA